MRNQQVVRCVHIISSLRRGGAQVMLEKLIASLRRDRFRCSVISLVELGPIGERLKALGHVEVHALNLGVNPLAPVGLWRLYWLLRRYRPHLVQTWMYHADLIGGIMAKVAGTGLVWNLRCSDLDLRRYSRQLRLVIRLNALLSFLPDVVVANSEAAIRWHQGLGYRPREWAYVPNGFAVDQLGPKPDARGHVRRELRVGEDAMLVGLLARFDPMKDHAGFLRAAGRIARDRADVHFVLCGDQVAWDNPILAGLVREEGLVGRAHLLGPRDDIPSLMAALDVLVSSSAFGEGFSNVVSEAMASGVPCVVTDVGDSRDLVADTGIVVPPRWPEALAEGLGTMLSMPGQERQRLGMRARERISQNYELSKIVAQYEALYARLASEQRPSVTWAVFVSANGASGPLASALGGKMERVARRYLKTLQRRLLEDWLVQQSAALAGLTLNVGSGDEDYGRLAERTIGIDLYRPRGSAVRADLQQPLPFRSGVFDSAICTEVLEHLAHPDRVLREVYRVLRPGAKSLWTVPFVFHQHGDPSDYYRYTPEGLRTLLEDAGFDVEETQGLGNRFLVATLLVDSLGLLAKLISRATWALVGTTSLRKLGLMPSISEASAEWAVVVVARASKPLPPASGPP